MEKFMNGELRLADGKPVGKVVEWSFEHDAFEPPKNDFREMFNKPIEGKIEGTFVAGEGLNAFIDMLRSEPIQAEVTCYITKQRYWELQYLAQGKRYPNVRKCKSKIRMSKKWRYRT